MYNKTKAHNTHRALLPLTVAALFLLTTACVQRDPLTGDVVPQGNQRYPYQDVKQRAQELIPGMSRRAVLILLGSPAHRSGDDWVYLPERSGLILPAEALRVRFRNGRYTGHAHEPIILGERIPIPQN